MIMDNSPGAGAVGVTDLPRSRAPEPAALPLDAERSLPAHPFAFVLHVALGRYRWLLLLLVASEALNASCGIMLPYALGRIISGVTGAGGGERGLAALALPLSCFVGLCMGELVFGRLGSALQLRVAPRQRQYVARSLFAYLHRHSHRFLTESFAGALAHRISEVSHGTNQVLWAMITEFWPIGIVILVANVLLARTDPRLGAFAAAWSVVFVAVSVVLARRTQPLAHAASSARSKSVGLVVDSISNHATVRLFAELRHERERLDRAYASELETVLRSNLAMERVRLFQFGASALLKAGIVGLSVWLWARGAIEVGQFVMASPSFRGSRSGSPPGNASGSSGCPAPANRLW